MRLKTFYLDPFKKGIKIEINIWVITLYKTSLKKRYFDIYSSSTDCMSQNITLSDEDLILNLSLLL